jgi:hypothetical protein
LGKHQELEKQEIYCSSLADLNDPMEGFKDLVWSGDKIIWKNLLRHYLLCLDHACIAFLLNGNNTPIDPASLPVLQTEQDLPTQEYKNVYKKSCDLFFNTPSVPKSVEGLAARQRPIRRDELCCHLRRLHYHALNALFTAYRDEGIVLDASFIETLRDLCAKMPIKPEIFGMTNGLEERHPDVADGSDRLYSAMNAISLQEILIGKYNNPASSAARNSTLIFAEFPDQYATLIEKMVHADWYTACFSTTYANSSMWGNYADHHRGVCLKFSTGTIPGKHSLALSGITGRRSSTSDPVGTPICAYTSYQLHKVTYKPTYPTIDFFRSLGHLRGIALGWWYSDGEGNTSLCAHDVFENESAWRDKYWAEFLEGQTTKIEDWDYEEEYRLVLSSSLTDYSKESRALKYRFSDLKGIIFGIKTPEEDKLAIIRVIQAKCVKEDRKEFEFYQAYYAKRTGRIDVSPLSLIKF